MAFSFIQYNNKFLIAVSNFLPIGKVGVKGYVPLPYSGEPYNDIAKAGTTKFMITPYGIEYLDKIINLCNKNQIN